MIRRSQYLVHRAALALALLALLVAPLGALAQAPSDFIVMASGLNNPRGIAIAPNGSLYVAEAGAGGDLCVDFPYGPSPVQCFGRTGAITRIDVHNGLQRRVVDGLPSHSNPGGTFAIGPQDIAFHGTGNAYATVGFGGDPTHRADFPFDSEFGQIVRLNLGGGSATAVADPGQFEAAYDPDHAFGGHVDINPYSLIMLDSRSLVMADAGANDLLEIDAQTGESKLLAVFPPRVVNVPPLPFPFPLPPELPSQFVPNSLALGPDGAYYVGGLRGFPFTPGTSQIFKVVPGQQPTPVAEDLTSIIDIAFGPEGRLYVLEIAKHGLLAGELGDDWAGALIAIDSQGNKEEIASEGLWAPTGMAIADDGSIYVSNNGLWPGQGTVVKVR